MHLAAYGRLGADPKEIVTKTGNAMSVGNLAVNLPDRQGDEHTQWIGVVAFGRAAETLLKHEKGELLSVSGRVQLNVYTSSGDQQEQLQVIADVIVSARSARPGGGRKRNPEGTIVGTPAQADFNDPIPF